jgi:hypothetical protein
MGGSGGCEYGFEDSMIRQRKHYRIRQRQAVRRGRRFTMKDLEKLIEVFETGACSLELHQFSRTRTSLCWLVRELDVPCCAGASESS